MSISKYRITKLTVCLMLVNLVAGAEAVYDVRDYGAKAGGKTLCTESIQVAMLTKTHWLKWLIMPLNDNFTFVFAQRSLWRYAQPAAIYSMSRV